jgi:hypothetical protein
MSGVEIHPGAQIGRRLVVDHGSNVVIGETAILGDDCYILNNVTLGALGVADNKAGRRHPKLGDRVQIANNVSVLGPIEIGDDVFIGPGLLITKDIPGGGRATRLQEILLERSDASVTAEIHGVKLLDAAEGLVEIIGRNLHECICDTVELAANESQPHPSATVLKQQADEAFLHVWLKVGRDVDPRKVGLLVIAPGAQFIITESLGLRRAIEALRSSTQ